MTYQNGQTIINGKYRIEALIGEGAFAEVYRVTHLGLQVPRALKVLRGDKPGLGSTEFSNFNERFLLEAQIGARLNTPTPHPNLLQVHDFIANEDLLALEMEYASGGSLTERIQRSLENGTPIPVKDVLQISVNCAQGLAAIHARDIIHRDLKPSNILFDSQGNAKAADLGLAQVPGGPSMRSKLSIPQPHPGTPGYMSPEQENTLGVLRPPSDIYALGLVMFEMLTCRNYTFVKPGTRASELRSDIPSWLDDLLESMLAKEPDKRPWDGKKTTELLSAHMQKPKDGQEAIQVSKDMEENAGIAELEKATLERSQETPIVVEVPSVKITPTTTTTKRPVGIFVILLVVVLALGLGSIILGGNSIGPLAGFWEKTATPTYVTVSPTLRATPTRVIQSTPTVVHTPTTKMVIFTVKASSVNLRAGPNLGHPEFSISNKTGTLMEIIGKYGETTGNYWFLVRSPDGNEGWLFEAWLNVDMNEMDNIPILTNIPTPPSNVKPTKRKGNEAIGTP